MSEKQSARPTKTAPPPNDASIEGVHALMDERRQYESWLSALDARRDTTPERVFTRVRADYAARLDAVVARLVSHAGALRAEVERLTTALSDEHTQQQQTEDERAEAELRAHVGELAPADWQRVAAASDERLATIARRREELQSSLDQTRDILADAERPTPALASPAIARDTTAVPDTAEASLFTPGGSAPIAANDTVAASSAGEHTTQESVPAELPPHVIAAEAALNDEDQPPASKRASAPDRQGFDELAFLSSVVDTPSGSMDRAPQEPPDEKSRRDSFALRSQDDEIEHLDESQEPALPATAGKPRAGAKPLADNITGSSPIVLKDPGQDGAKTLTCAECSAMNYPTEWYCERCGAELASL